ncbi:c-type heme family protein [Thiovibrio sp. JS02]
MSDASQPKTVTDASWRIERYSLIVASLLTCLVGLSAFWYASHYNREIDEIAFAEAKAYFNRDVALRQWSATHGGVYVPVSERTRPNPFLGHVPERDINTPSGKALTLMNPAYMVRQLNEDFSKNYGIGGHITSLKPLRPENRPDPWEKSVLEKFQTGLTEFHEFTEIGGKPFLRLMKPIYVEKGCLKCHGHQGYTVGEVRGGVSVSLPMETLNQHRRYSLRASSLGHAAIWLLGLLGIFFCRDKILRFEKARSEAERNLKESEEKHRLIVENQADLIVKIDPQLRFTFVSPSYLATFAKQEAELLGTNLFPLIHEDDRERVRDSLAEIFSPPYAANHEERALTAAGWRWFHWSAKAFVDGDGEVREIVSVGRDITVRKELEAEREKLIGELSQALEKVKVLSGMLPICATCKKIRDDRGYWQQLETFIHHHSDATFTHGICPDCAQKELDKLKDYDR